MKLSTAQWLGPTIAVFGLLFGCSFADPPPDPEVQPLEIVVGNPDRGPCLLNVHEVGAGTHDVMVLSMAGEATARILDPSGKVLFKRNVKHHPAEGGGLVVTEEDQGSVQLGAGAHRVRCTTSEGTTSVRLRVVPARPGYDQSGPG